MHTICMNSHERATQASPPPIPSTPAPTDNSSLFSSGSSTKRRGTFSPMSNTSILPVAKDQFQIRPDLTFLNHGSFGACPRPVFETYQEWQRRLEADPV